MSSIGPNPHRCELTLLSDPFSATSTTPTSTRWGDLHVGHSQAPGLDRVGGRVHRRRATPVRLTGRQGHPTDHHSLSSYNLRSPTTPALDCENVLAGRAQSSLTKAIVGGDEFAGFNVIRIDTARPTGVYHVVDCIRTDQVFPTPAVITAVDLGEVSISGTATFRVDIPFSAVPGSNVCDRTVLSGSAGGELFSDISNEVCAIYSSCLFEPECPQNQPPTTVRTAVTTARPPTSSHGNTLPFTGRDERPLLITAVALLGVGSASLVAARRRHE